MEKIGGIYLEKDRMEEKVEKAVNRKEKEVEKWRKGGYKCQEKVENKSWSAKGRERKGRVETR